MKSEGKSQIEEVKPDPGEPALTSFNFDFDLPLLPFPAGATARGGHMLG
jgi:hypothetical protein